MSIPFDPPRLQCEGCEDFFNIGDIEQGLCPSCLKAAQADCLHSSRTHLEGGTCNDCGIEFKEPSFGKEYEAEERS